jgi:hypothetical protein
LRIEQKFLIGRHTGVFGGFLLIQHNELAEIRECHLNDIIEQMGQFKKKERMIKKVKKKNV